MSSKKKAPPKTSTKVPTPGAPVTGQPPSLARANALRALQGVLGSKPANFTNEEWAVVNAALDPDRIAHYSQRKNPWLKYQLAARARSCFPGLPTSQALRAYTDALALPHVAELISSFRHIELLDFMEARQSLRLASYSVLNLERLLHEDDLERDRKGTAAIAREVLGAVRMLMELDDLKIQRATESTSLIPEAPEEDLMVAVDKVMEDLAARQEDKGET